MDNVINKALAFIAAVGPGGENLMTYEEDKDDELSILLQTLKVLQIMLLSVFLY